MGSGARRGRAPASKGIAKTPTGIAGLDHITGGGLPAGRPTLVTGAAGCGKTLLAAEFIVRGIERYGEAGVFVSFEETAEELAANLATLGLDFPGAVARKQLAVDYVHIDRSEIEETGEYDLGGLFVRLGAAVDEVGAKRVVLDSIETLFAGLQNAAILRAELKRLFRWLKQKGVTAVVTGEEGTASLTRRGLEEYVSDCVIVLDHRVSNQIATRRLRVVKYRGSRHETDEYPFLIDDGGIQVLPITSLSLDYRVTRGRVSTGIPGLDTMLGGKGYFRGSSILVSGTAGTGKTSLAAVFANSVCASGQRCLYFALEESPEQLVRNMRSIGMDLERWRAKGLLEMSASRPSAYGFEMRLVLMHQLIERFKPSTVVVDPVSNLLMVGTQAEAKAMLTRLVDYLKNKGITAFFTSLTPGGEPLQETEVMISSLIDTWILMRDVEGAGERNRSLSIVKSRGMSHSNEAREFLITSKGIQILEVFRGPTGVMIGSERLQAVQREKELVRHRRADFDRQRERLERRRDALEKQIEALRASFEADTYDGWARYGRRAGEGLAGSAPGGPARARGREGAA
jgi:circadian clock protein KaiC